VQYATPGYGAGASYDEDGPQPFPRSGNNEGGQPVFQGDYIFVCFQYKIGHRQSHDRRRGFSIPARPAGEWVGHDLSNSVLSDDFQWSSNNEIPSILLCGHSMCRRGIGRLRRGLSLR